MDVIQFVMDNWTEIVNLVTALVSLCAAIAALTPTPADDVAIAKLRKIVDFLGMNWGHAKNGKK